MTNTRFEASYERLFGRDLGGSEQADGFFVRFYEHFLSSEDVAQRFADVDMAQQIRMLRRSFYLIAGFYITEEPSGELDRLAQSHREMAISPALFDRWADAVVATVREMDPECDEATELAWRWAIAPALTYFKLASRGLLA